MVVLDIHIKVKLRQVWSGGAVSYSDDASVWKAAVNCIAGRRAVNSEYLGQQRHPSCDAWPSS